jgi:hypothetical protein
MMGTMLPIWEDTMPPASEGEITAVGKQIAAAMTNR